ncbi:MAG: AAA family ATPase [Gemmataceae bacterium]|nr:AAA family ATPase [Gemmataceae bacterium]
MTTSAATPRPWSERQREALRTFVRASSARAQKEAEIQNGFAGRAQAIDAELREAQASLEAEYLQSREQLAQAFDERQDAMKLEYQQQVTATSEELYRHKDEARSRYRTAKDALFQEFKESRWTTQTVFEADKKVAKDNMVLAMRKARQTVERTMTARKEAFLLLKRWGVLDGPPEPFSANLQPGAEPTKALDACAESAAQCLAQLQEMRLPRYVRGIWPYLFLACAWAIATSPAYFIAEWYFWVFATSLTVIPFGLWLRQKMIDWTEQRSLAIFEVMHQAVADARAWFGRCVQLARDHYRAQKKQLKKRIRRQLRDLTVTTKKRLAALRRQRSGEIHGAEETYEPMLFRLRRGHDAKVQADAEQHQAQLATVDTRREEQLQQTTARHRKLHDENNRRHAEEWTQLARGWKYVCDQTVAVFGQVDRDSRPFFGDWDPAKHPADRGMPWGLRFGALAMTPAHIPMAMPDDGHLVKPDFSGFAVPALLPFPERAALLFEARDQGRKEAVRALEAFLLRAWLALPPGKLRCTIIDPVGRGADFAAFMHLDDHDPALVNSRIWTEPEHIDDRLADMTAHMETILQKYLRNQFQSLAEYNAQAGEVAEPFRFLVVAHFPTNFSPEAAKRLLSLASSGARCGICTFIVADMRQPLPQGVSWEDFEKACTLLTWRGDHYVLEDEDFARFPLRLEELPSEAQCTKILQEVGARAVRAMKVEVPFTSIAPRPDQCWTEDSRSGLSVPLGRAGANRLQYLTLGQGTSQHALVAGKTGSGKSTLLHVLIMQLALRYSPEEVELYLIDFKKGVEFKTYASHALPHARVVAVESEREFGLSVLHRLDAELARRGEAYRKAGVNDLASYRNFIQNNGQAGDHPSLPRIMLVVDEFQEFFVEDDKLAQEASLLLDRLVRQGRAFGMHILLGSQTLGGAYSLARTTIDQMAVRIALQCSEADAHLILSRDNTEARLLSRPGEAIYNAANGLLEGNNFFQIVWLDDDRRDHLLNQVRDMSERRGVKRAEPLIVFEGNVLADMRGNPRLLPGAAGEGPKTSWSAWLGDAVAIKEPTRAVFRRQSASNLMMVGQQDEAALALFVSSALSLAAGQPDLEPMPMVFAQAVEGLGDEVVNALPDIAAVTLTPQRELPALLNSWNEELDKRNRGESRTTPRFLFLYGLHRLRDVRRPDDDFGFSRKGEEASPYRQLVRLLREGPPVGLFTIVWCDTAANLQRYFDRQTLREFEMRVVFQMSATDSSTLMDTPVASRLGPQRAIFYTEDQGKLEKFRPYALPAVEWLRGLKR